MSADHNRCGTIDTHLVIIRGNSGSGKSSIAREIRSRYGHRGIGLIEQDYLRRILLRERDRPGGIAPDLIETNARFVLDHGYHAIVEGILHTERYAAMLRRLITAHAGRTSVYYLDVSFAETLRRHATRPQAAEFTPEHMAGWYAEHDLLGVPGEQVIEETSPFDGTVEFILTTSGLLDAPTVVPGGIPT
ncbi:kinase [Dactylosporangium sp. NPDC000244]|uniref:kinase n=1 Tax=Dactylosporangium sp. NPDC000244 TaxID=3154365 RepID=UPI0033305289